jgi:predicted phosphoadenosine phosphosulfate sulfurtransferase
MSQPNVIPLWYQVPIFMTNAASHQLFLWAWGENEEWVREKPIRFIVLTTNTLSDFTSSICGGSEFEKKRGKEKVFPLLD